MAYSTINKHTDHFNTKLYTGTGSSNAITGVGFQPDFTWIKDRDATNNHSLYDAVRGVTNVLLSNATNAETTYAQGLTAFGTDGFTVGADSQNNTNGNDICSWNWKAGTSFTNDASSTGIGTIDSTGSVNDTAGFSIVSWSGTGTAGTIKHGLSTTPKMIIVKVRNFATNWLVQHGSIASTKVLYLDATNAESTDDSFNDTLPTSSVFSVKTANGINASGKTYVAYCFAEKTGYCKMGVYYGNGVAGDPYVHLGFKPTFLLIKNSNATQSWRLVDAKRFGYNPKNIQLYPNLTNAESTSEYVIDLVSTGFRVISTDAGVNGNGNRHIYLAIGQTLVGSNNVCATAR